MDSQASKREIKKPGLSNDKQKALDNLFKARTYGVKRTDQIEDNSEESEKNQEKVESDDDELGDFIDKEGYGNNLKTRI
jgi:hypothetical protein